MDREKDCNWDDRRSMTFLNRLICTFAADGGGGDGWRCLLNNDDGGVVSSSSRVLFVSVEFDGGVLSSVE